MPNTEKQDTKMSFSALKEIIRKGESETLEFKSNFGNEAIETLVAFSNTKGGQVIIGITPQNEITGVKINPETLQNWVNEIKNKTAPNIIPDIESFTVENKEIVVLSVQEYPVKPVSTRGRYFKRVANSNHLLSISEVVNIHLQTFNTSWDYHLNNEYSVEDISIDKVQNAIQNVGKDVGKDVTDLQRKIQDYMKNDPFITIPELAKLMSVTNRTVERNIAILKEKGIIRRYGGRKDGKWIVYNEE